MVLYLHALINLHVLDRDNCTFYLVYITEQYRKTGLPEHAITVETSCMMSNDVIAK